MYEQDYDLGMDTNRMGGFLAGVLVGALAGAAAMLLFAPESGAKTRKKLRKKAVALAESLGDTYDETVDMARERAMRMTDDVRGRMDEAQSTGKDLLEEQKSKVQSIVQAGRDVLRRR
jgi:gas vesicle protein